MLKISTTVGRQKGFTLLEVLVVIAIIAILCSVGGAAYSGVMTAARKSSAHVDMESIITAVNNFKVDYGEYPLPQNLQGKDTTFGEAVPYTSQLMDVLRANYFGWDDPNGSYNINPHQNRYLNAPYVKNKAKPVSGIGADGQFYDPWGRTYFIRIDGNYDNTVANPYSANAGGTVLPQGVIVWSFGPDSQPGTGSTPDKNVGQAKDDVVSW